jgi:hypothetical protein
MTVIAEMSVVEEMMLGGPVLKCVPNELRELWAQANARVYGWLDQEQEQGRKCDCALMWVTTSQGPAQEVHGVTGREEGEERHGGREVEDVH